MNAPVRKPSIPVVWRQRHFVGAAKIRVFDVTLRAPTIAEIIASIPVEELPRGFFEIGEVWINDEMVARGVWHLLRPRYRPGRDTIVSLRIRLGDGGGTSSSGGSQKSTTAMVASIAVLLVAAAVSGGALAPLGGGLFAAGSVSAAVAGAGIGIAGALAIASLTPRPSLASPSATTAAAGTTSATASAASLTGNIQQQGASVPRVIGTMQLFPPLACNPLVEVVGDLEYAEAVFILAGPHTLTGAAVGGTSIDSIAEAVQQIVEGKPGDPIQTLVQRYSYTSDVNAQMSAHLLDATTQYLLQDQTNPAADIPQPTPGVSRDSPDEIWINLAWTEGLSSNTTSAVINQAFRTQIRPRGSTGAWTDLPEVHFSMNAPDAFQKVIRIKWGAMPFAPNTPPTNAGAVYAFKTVPGQNGTSVTPSTSGWTADASFSSGSGSDVLSNATFGASHILNTELYDDKVIFYLDPTAFPQGFYELQVTASSAYNSASFTPGTYTYSGSVLDFFNYYLASGSYRIPEDPTPLRSTVEITRLSSVWNQNPIQSPDFATMSVKVHSRQLDQYSIIASGYTYDWDGAGWNTFTTTSNPAPHARDVLTGILSAKPVPTSLINDDEFVAWRTDAINRSLTVNAVVEGKFIMDVLNMIAGCTHAAIRHNEKWGVYLDRDRSGDSPLQLFTPRNMANFSWTRAWVDNPSGIIANYVDADNDYDTSAEDIIYADPTVQNSDLLSQQTYDGLVHKADVEAQATNDLLQLKYRFTFYQFDVSADSLVAQRGDLVAVQHDTLSRKVGSSRIVSVTKSGSNIIGLTLDGSVPVWTTSGIQSLASVASAGSIADLGQQTAIAIRLKQGAGILGAKVITASVNGENVNVTFATPFADPGNLETDCLVSVGPLGSEYKRLIVYGVQPKADLQATVTCVDEAPQLWN